MNSDSPDRAEATFNSALSRPPAEREAFLAEACGDDTVLMADVRALLSAHEGAGGFMQDDAPLSSEHEGERIGRYKLLQEIGEGGFGTVWMAEQVEPVSRRVALKIIKLGMDTREVIARFEAERQALAMMEHPNIAKVLDAGATDSGRPFFVMELVKGMPITNYCDEAGLGTRERLELFGDVCSAIQHAHQKGVIHRDIKPSNVMVTLHGDKPVVEVIDFGIAKATQGRLTDKTLFTRFEQFIGTPVYMSPEQASMSGLDVDTRSDIYALGILLYELLTGRPPFDAKSLVSAGYEEMRRIIREVEPPKPSSRLSTVAGVERTQLAKARRIEPEKLSRLVEPDLDWIVMKAIEKDRTRRYETTNAFAQDIAHFLADEPVSATPPSASYRFRKFARRNKTALRIAAGIAIVLVAATAVSTWQAVRATRAEKVTAAERDAKELARLEAEAVSNFMFEVFRSPDPTRDGRTITVAETLDKAAKKLEADLAAQPVQRARLQVTLGQTYQALGLTQQGIPLVEQGHRYFREAFGPEHPRTLSSLGALVSLYNDAGRRDEALQLSEELLQLRRKTSGLEHSDTLAAMNQLGVAYQNSGRNDDALRLFEELLTLLRKESGPDHATTIGVLNNLAISHELAGRESEALKVREEVLELSRKVNGPEHPSTLAAMNNLALSYAGLKRTNEALKLRQEVLKLSEKVLGPEHPETISAMTNLASSYRDISRISRKAGQQSVPEELLAFSMQTKALELRRKVNGPEHVGTLGAMTNLAIAYRMSGQPDKAIPLQEEALAIKRRVLPANHPFLRSALGSLANLYQDTGRHGEALKLWDELLVFQRTVEGPEHPQTLAAMVSLAICYGRLGRHDEKLALWQELLPLHRKVHGPEHPDTLTVMQSLATAYADVGRQDEALQLRQEGLKLIEKVLGPEHPETAKAMISLANSLRAVARINRGRGGRNPDEESQLFDAHTRALELSRKALGAEHPDTLGAMTNLAIAYADTGDVARAIPIQEEALAIKRRVLPADHRYLPSAILNLANLYQKAGRLDESLPLRVELVAFYRAAHGPAHQQTLAAMGALATAHRAKGDTAKAEAIEKEIKDAQTNR